MVHGIHIVTDSCCPCPDILAAEFGVAVVPLVVVIDGQSFREGVDLATDKFYEILADGAQVSTAAPAPGEFLQAYEAAAEAGATRVVSLHLDAGMSGTVNAARIAAGMSPVPVDVIDTRALNFGLYRCVRAAAEALRDTGDVAAAQAAAKGQRDTECNIVVIGRPDLLARSGRLTEVASDISMAEIWAGWGDPSEFEEVAKVDDLSSMTEAFVAYAKRRRAPGARLVGVGDVMASSAAEAVAEAFEATGEFDVQRFNVSAAVAAHLGPGSVIANFLLG